MLFKHFKACPSLYALLIPLILFLTASKDSLHFPLKEHVRYGYYKAIKEKKGMHPTGTVIAFYDEDGNKLLADYGPIARAGLLDDVYSGEFFKVGWYSTCMFKYINLEYPCAEVVSLELNGEELVSYSEAKELYSENKAIRYLATYLYLILFLLATPVVLITCNRNKRNR